MHRVHSTDSSCGSQFIVHIVQIQNPVQSTDSLINLPICTLYSTQNTCILCSSTLYSDSVSTHRPSPTVLFETWVQHAHHVVWTQPGRWYYHLALSITRTVHKQRRHGTGMGKCGTGNGQQGNGKWKYLIRVKTAPGQASTTAATAFGLSLYTSCGPGPGPGTVHAPPAEEDAEIRARCPAVTTVMTTAELPIIAQASIAQAHHARRTPVSSCRSGQKRSKKNAAPKIVATVTPATMLYAALPMKSLLCTFIWAAVVAVVSGCGCGCGCGWG